MSNTKADTYERNGWEAMAPDWCDEWHMIPGAHCTHIEAACKIAEDYYADWWWESASKPQNVTIRSPEGLVEEMTIEVEFEPTFYARERQGVQP